MNNSKNALSNLTKSRWLRLSASVGLALGLALVLLLLPITAGMSVVIPVPVLTQLNAPTDSVAQPNWSLSSKSIEVGLPLGVDSAMAGNGITVLKTANVITAYQGGLPFSISPGQSGEIIYTIQVTNNTGLTINGPFYISDTIPAGTVCSKTDNNGNANWTHNLATCESTRVAQFTLPSGQTWTNGVSLAFKFTVLPDGKSGSFVDADGDYSVYTVTNASVKLHNPGGTFNAGAVNTDNVNVPVVVKAPAWTVSKVDENAGVIQKGGYITYDVTIMNSGAYTINPNVVNVTSYATTSSVTITEQLPAEAVYATATAMQLKDLNIGWTTIDTTTGLVTWVITDPSLTLEPGASYSPVFTVGFATNSSLPSGYNIQNTTYSVTGAENVYRPATGAVITTVVQGTQLVTVTKRAYAPANDTTSGVCTGAFLFDASTCVPASGGGMNGSLIYTIRITPTEDIVNMQLVDTLPLAYVSYVSRSMVSPITTTFNFARSTVGTDDVITVTFPTTLTANTPYIFNIGVKTVNYGLPGDPFFNTLKVSPVAKISTDNLDFDLGASLVVETIREHSVISAINKIWVTKTVQTNQNGFVPVGQVGFAKPGEPITYTLSVVNVGPNGIADNVQLTDTPFASGTPGDNITLRGDLGVLYDGTQLVNPAGFGDATDVAGTYDNATESALNIGTTAGLVLTAGTPAIQRDFAFFGTAPTLPLQSLYQNSLASNYTIESPAVNSVASIIVPNVAISMTKEVSHPNLTAAGWVFDGVTPVTYTYMITNNSNVTLTTLNLTDNRIGTISTTAYLPLNPGSSATITASYVPSYTHLTPGTITITNWAYVTSTATVNSVVVTATALASASLRISDTLAFTVTKGVVKTTMAATNYLGKPTVGDVIQYVYTVTNQSSRPGRLTALTDPLLDGGGTIIGGVVATDDFDPFQTKVYSSNYIITLDNNDIALAAPTFDPTTGDITFTNVVSITGNIFSDATKTVITATTNVTNSAFQLVTYTSQISVMKYAVVSGRTYTQAVDAWDMTVVPTDTLEYYIFITNTGQVPVVFPPGAITDVIELANPAINLSNPVTVTLAPGAAVDRAAIFGAVTVTTYLSNNPITLSHFVANIITPTGVNGTVTADDLSNIVGAAGASDVSALPAALQTLVITSQNLAVPNSISDNLVIMPLVYTASVQIQKTPSITTVALNGSVFYTYIVTNTGNVPLVGAVITDETEGNLISLLPNVTVASGITLVPGVPQTFVGPTIVYSGGIVNAVGGDGAVVDNTATVTGYVVAPGLAVNENNAHYTATASSSAQVTVTVSGAFSVTKQLVSVGDTMGNPAVVGDVLTYVYQINMIDPTTPITNITINDVHLNLAGTGNTMTVITSGLTLSGTAGMDSYVFTMTDVVDDRDLLNSLPNLYITNTVTADGQLQGTTVKGNVVYLNDTTLKETRAYLTFTNDITMTKEVMNVESGISSGVSNTSPITANIGQTLWYTYTIYNAGNLSYHAYYIQDETLPNGIIFSGSDSFPTVNPSLAVLGSQTVPSNRPLVLTSSFKVDANTKAFVQAQLGGFLVNTATAWLSPTVLLQRPTQAMSAGIYAATAWMTQSVELSSPTSIDLTKVADWAGKTMSPTVAARLGEVVTYTYIITNTGSVDFEPQFNPDQTAPFGGVGVTLVDDKLGQILILPNTPGLTNGKLATGASISVTQYHVITYSDLNASMFLTNSAKVTGYVSAAFGDEITNPGYAQAGVPLDYDVFVSVDKNVFPPTGVTTITLGMPVTYTLLIQSASDVPVTITIKDVFTTNPAIAEVPSVLSPTVIVLQPFSSQTITYVDSVNPAYLDPSIDGLQDMTNYVMISADDGVGNMSGGVYTATDSTTIQVEYNIDFDLHKEVVGSNVVNFVTGNETVTYRYVITNTGGAPLTLATLWDTFAPNPPFGQRPNVVITSNVVLAAGESKTFEWTTTITDNDIPVITNTAVASVTASGNITDAISIPNDNGVPVTVTINFTPSLKVIKAASVSEARIGDTITYTVLVANDGIVTLRDIIFSDPLLGVVNKTSINLSPGGVPAQFVVTKTITQKDFDTLQEGGAIINTAHVTGTRLTDWPFTSNPVTVTIRSGASLALTKIGSATSVQVPATVAYTYTVTNNGTVDLTGITLTDDKLTLNVTPFDLAKNGVKVVTASTLLSTPNVTVTNLATAQALFGTTPVVATATWTVKTTAAPVTATCTVAVAATSPVVVNTAAFFTATVTASPTGTSTFAWNFGDGGTGTVNPISHTFTTTGTKAVTVTVTNSNGSTCVNTAQVQVNAANVPTPNLVVTKSTERPQVLAVGTRITYTIRVSNTGTAVANNIVITDVLPAEVTLVASPTTTAGTVTVNGSTVRVEVLSLDPQAAPVVVTIVVEVDNDGVGKTTIVNTAFVSSDEQTVANSGQVTDQTPAIQKPTVSLYLPIILKQPATTEPTATPVTPTPTATSVTPGQPNLQSTIKLPASVVVNQALDVEVVVKNAGGAAVSQGFWVEFYINPNDSAGITTRGGRWDSDENLGTLADPLGKQGIAWFVKASDFGGSLAPGASITLVSRPAGDAGLNGRVGFEVDQTTWHGRFVSGTSTLVSYADSFAGSGKNVYIVTESNENDNANTATSFGPLGVAGVDLTRGPFHPAR